MTIASANLLPDNTTDTNFRTWGKFISDSLTSFGLTKTADSGQIDWNTTLKPAQGTVAGYEIRQFTDSLQSTTPLVFKIEYGTDSSTTLRPQLWFTFGKGSNGTGGITNILVNRIAIGAGSSSTTTTYPCNLSGSANRLTMAMWFTFPGNGFFMSLERTKDVSGNDSSDGAMLTLVGSGATVTIRINQFIPYSGVVPNSQDLGVHLPLGVTSGVDGADVNYYPNFFYRNGTPLNPGITHFAYFSPDATPYNQAPVPVYGVNRNYFFVGNNSPLNTFTRGGTTGLSIGMLWE